MSYRTICLLLSAALLLPLLVACGSDDEDPTTTPEASASTATSAPATEPTETEAAEPTEGVQPTEAVEPTEKVEPTEAAEPTAEEGTATTGGAAEADLAAVKTFALEHGEALLAAAEELNAIAGRYYALLSSAGFDVEAAVQANPMEMPGLMLAAKETWIAASTEYELDEGIVAGVPSLAEFDVWLDAGPTGAEAPDEARDWQLELPDGTVLDQPGNIFHHLLEPALWGTNPEFVALPADLNGDGEAAPDEVYPEANRFVAAAGALFEASTELQAAIEAWEPTLDDVFTALVVMIPTMNEYFEQWKLSVFVAGAEGAEEQSFIALSRLFDILGILTGLDFTYDSISPLVAEQDADLDAQIQSGFDDLLSYVQDLYDQEQGGVVFTPEEADLFGSDAQDQATALSGQVAQAAALVGAEIAE